MRYQLRHVPGARPRYLRVSRTSEQIGMNPQARSAQEAALPVPPAPSTTRPAEWRRGRRGSAGGPHHGRRRRVEQLDGQLPPIDQAASEDHHPDVVAVDLDDPAVMRGPLHTCVVVEVAAPLESLAGPAGRDEHDVQRSDLEVRTGDGAQDVGLGERRRSRRRPAPPARPDRRQPARRRARARPARVPAASGGSTSYPPSAGGNDSPAARSRMRRNGCSVMAWVSGRHLCHRRFWAPSLTGVGENGTQIEQVG